jgi:hypothetical protein
MKTRTYQFLALAAVMTLYPVAASYADSTTPPTEQGSTPGTTPMKKHHHHHKIANGDHMSNTSTGPKLDNKVPAGNDASPSH